MIAKIGDRGNLNGNIEAFLTAGHVAEQDHKLFKEKIIEIGNAAMHRGYNPTAQDVETLLSITESLIASIYTHPYRVGQMAQSMPPRISREKAPPLSQPRNF